MRRHWVWTLLLLALAPAGWARERPDDKDKPSTPAEQYKALVQEHSKAQEVYSNLMRAAKTNEERQAVFEKHYPKPQTYSGRFLKLAQDNPKDEVAVDALLWVARFAGRSPDGKKAQEVLVRDYIESSRLSPLCQNMGFSRDSGAAKVLRQIMEKNTHKEVQGNAIYALALCLKQRVADTKDGDSAALESQVKEAEKLFERVIAEFAEVQYVRGTLGTQAESQLKGLRNLLNLVVGKPAPETEGEDIDGNKFKLSEYRGKVVVLDFWGHW